ncbi:MAG: transcription-repair coupling factor [Spirochaetes bacterium]|nr:transcription-repair coupling factor [Spirochaetota bacterium]
MGKKHIIKATEDEADELFEALQYFTDARVLRFPAYDVLPFTESSPTRETMNERIRVLHEALSASPMVIVTSVKALLKTTITPAILKSHTREITSGGTLDRDAFRKELRELGYIETSGIEEEGECSFRGGIIDVFPPSYDNPVRIELFDDRIESIRFFSTEDQRSIASASTVHIIPAREVPYTDDVLAKGQALAPDITERFLRDAYFPGSENYAPFFHEMTTPLAYFSAARVYWSNDALIADEAKRFAAENAVLAERSGIQDTRAYAAAETVLDNIKHGVTVSAFAKGTSSEVVFQAKHGENFKAKIKEFMDYLLARIGEGYRINLATNYDEQAKRFADLLAPLNAPIVPAGTDSDSPLIITVGNITEGFVSPEMKYILLADREVFGRTKKKHKKVPRVKQSIIESFVDLNINDFVVHINHGIGIYRGLIRLQAAGTEKDYLNIEYAKGDKLYIPVEQVNFIQKYLSASTKTTPKLDVLGGKAWDKIKARARKSAEKIAGELIKIYTVRHALSGYSFPRDTTWQEDFEASFKYQETPDQLRAIEEIKHDMEAAKVMDRLVCGDVGFGKTEVALRAAFKAVMAGKQVALLCPTTVLSQQHFKTAYERFKNFPVSLGLINRFRTSAEQKETLARLKEGKIDILIGTHGILAKDVAFKDLGLIIIDEEQRFGVKQKEALKRYKVLVDVLTLTATPIPRTLNLALTQIRDVSIIATPPLNRVPIQTSVIEFNEKVMIDAIRRELLRGGQVFVVYNRVETILEFASMISRLMPEAVIATAHGQMEGHELERIMVDFIDEKYNVLVTTAIIENGIDIPNCNTIIIYRADRFGLADLYQLRGRVGRSDRAAYAYFFHPKETSITEDAYHRLTAIAEHTDLGSGFKIAMRDLEIRGAGDILGREQSGNIHAVGYELYTQLLEESVSKMKGEMREIVFDTVIDVRHNLFIPDTYVSDTKQKIELYKNILRVENEADIDPVREACKDRYGPLPPEIENLFAIARLKAYLKKHKVISVIEGDYNLYITLNEFSKVRPERIKNLVGTKGSGVYHDTVNLNRLVMPVREDTIEWKLNAVRSFIERIKK